mgnify:CR=1 FL=1
MGRVSNVGKVGGLLVVRALWLSLLVILPLFGMWLASSLAAYQNATQWTSLLIGLLLFPILPVGWDLLYAWRMKRRGDHRPILTRADRLVLQESVADPAALDSCDPMTGSSEFCCIEGTMYCPSTGQEWNYVCASRAKAASQCASHCNVACVRSEYNVCR